MYDFLRLDLSLMLVTYSLAAVFLWYFSRRLQVFQVVSSFSFLVAGIYVFQIVGLPFSAHINAALSDYYVSRGVKFLQVFVVFVGLTFIILGSELGTLLWRSMGFSSNEQRASKRFAAERGIFPLAVVVASIYGIIAALWLYATRGLRSNFSVGEFLTRGIDPTSYQSLRYEIAGSLRGAPALLNWVVEKSLYGMLPSLTILAVYALRERLGRRWQLVACVAMVAYANLAVPQKSRLVLFAAYTLIGLFLWKRRERVLATPLVPANMRTVMLGTVGLLFVAFLYSRQYRFSLVEGGAATAYRLFIENPRALELYVDYYPRFHPYLHGGSSSLVRTVLGVPGHNPDDYLPTVALGVPNTSWPTTYVGAAWADFGMVGVVLYSLIIGLVLRLIDLWARMGRPGPVRYASYLGSSFCCFGFGVGSMMTTFLYGGVMLNLVLYAFPAFLWGGVRNGHGVSPKATSAQL